MKFRRAKQPAPEDRPAGLSGRVNSASALAETRYFVRFAELTLGERLLDALTVSGFDAYGIASMGPPGFSFITNVVEVVARRHGRVVYRRRAEPEAIAALFDEIALDLVRYTPEAFEVRWLLGSEASP